MACAEHAMSRASLAWWVASVGGIGRVRVAPGTVGAALGAALYWVLPVEPVTQVLLLAGLTGAGVWASSVVVHHERKDDPSAIILDEMTGMLLACFLLPKEPWALVAAFGLFRFLDVTKLFLIGSCERLPGGWGVMMDDVAAGALTRVLLLWWYR
jgi:phosphatidylglycerophosphatase A